jgi:hypothetical protein
MEDVLILLRMGSFVIHLYEVHYVILKIIRLLAQ